MKLDHSSPAIGAGRFPATQLNVVLVSHPSRASDSVVTLVEARLSS
jgi:hypothetical protein